jgi:hypothetical protein
MSPAITSNPVTNDHRAITGAALIATYMQAVNISLPSINSRL